MDYAIIVAGGSGTRMQHNTPKQFLTLANKPVICHSIDLFFSVFPNIQCIVVLPEHYLNDTSLITKHITKKTNLHFVAGGINRFESVKNGLNFIDSNEQGIVFIHDAVRPLINESLLLLCKNEAEQHGNAIPCIEINDSLREITDIENHHVNRENYRSIQTPQTFQIQLIKKAFECEFKDFFTDDASVFEHAGNKIHLIQGLNENFKITRPIDLQLAEIILQA